ncbi:exosortase/archaeosortase family protein [bacterium]|nr:exosortase/archaeosortase family protein [bacterium]MCB2179347.1 exosortase/archaeosortase family protein [bacterium]
MQFLFLGIFILVWVIAIIFFRHYRVWFFYYLAGTIGLAFILVYLTKNILHAEVYLAQSVAFSVHHFANLIQIPTQIFPKAPGLLLVLVIVQNIGWTALEVGVESSSLLEMCVLVSIVVFYPGWNLAGRTLRILAGIALTWIANTMRMILIMLMLHVFGKHVLVLAHTFLGKLFFFICTIAIYWFLITRPTLKNIKANIFSRRVEAGA